MSGASQGPRAAAIRLALAAAEPFYAGATRLRNRCYDAGVRSIHRLPRPVVSVGNLTTGGTGKTPMVQWLVERLRGEGEHVAILSRGYKAGASNMSDELVMLDRALNVPGRPPVLLRANPDRVKAGRELLGEHAEISVFVLDDGFQHRRIGRDLDVVLISAAEPFGFGHVLPRGLLREPLAGLRRAGAAVITHADQASPEALVAIEAEIHRQNPALPVYHASHAQVAVREEDPTAVHPMDELSRQPYFVFCGIGNPHAFERQLARWGGRCVGSRFFNDHHRYTALDVKSLDAQAKAANARILLTTDKDWVKIAGLASSDGEVPIWRVEMRIEFRQDDDNSLLTRVRQAIASRDNS